MSALTLLSRTQDSFTSLLTPLPPFDAPYLPNISALDILGALRLSVIIRQLRRQIARPAGPPKGVWWHDLFLTLVVVFGGEMIAAALLTVPPSFMLSPTVTLLFVASHIAANALPEALVPELNLQSELPLSLLDAMTRSMLVCDGVVGMIKSNPNPALRDSPMALLITSTMLGNGGFFFVNAFNMLSPSGWSVSTPPELGPYGWSTTDLWIAPLSSALFATLTHAQPFWVDLQRVALEFLSTNGYASQAHFESWGLISPGGGAWFGKGGAEVQPLSTNAARSVCALIMVVLFSSRAVKNYWGAAVETKAQTYREQIKEKQQQQRQASAPPPSLKLHSVHAPVSTKSVAAKKRVPSAKVKKEE